MENKAILCDKLPRFGSTRKGTEVFIIQDGEIVSVYDDHSGYPGVSAKKWRVKVYNRTSGYEYDRICMSGGLYPTRGRALAEIERFRFRGEHLIFYVLPVGFTYDIIGMLWDGEPEYKEDDIVPATLEEQQEEARKRLFVMTGRRMKKDIDLVKKYKDTEYEQVITAFYETQKSLGLNYFPYALLPKTAVFYVGGNKASWKYERMYIISGCELYKGLMPAFVYDPEYPDFSEFGDVGYKLHSGSLCRTA